MCITLRIRIEFLLFTADQYNEMNGNQTKYHDYKLFVVFASIEIVFALKNKQFNIKINSWMCQQKNWMRIRVVKGGETVDSAVRIFYIL